MKRAPEITALLILLFVYTAISKLGDLNSLKNVLYKSPFGKAGGDWVAPAVPVAELGISLLLFFPATRQPGFLFAFFLLSAFTAYLVYMILFVPNLPCSCGGVIGSLGWKQHLVFNLILLLLAAKGWHLEKNRHGQPEGH